MKHRLLPLAVVSLALVVAGTAAAQPGPRGGGPRLQAMDSNQDGVITRAEVEAFHSQRFTEADTNGDQVLSVEEVTAAAQKRAGQRGPRMHRRLDTDGDGGITLAEFAVVTERPFQRLDTNQDGRIDASEMPTRRGSRGGPGGPGGYGGPRSPQ